MWKSILVAYDGSGPARRAVTLACDIAKVNPTAKVTFIHIAIVNGGAANTDQSVFDLAHAIQADLEQLANDLPNECDVRVVAGSAPAEILLRTAEEIGTDLIIMGSRGMGGVKGYLGSVSVSVTQRSRCCVLIAKE